VLLPVMGLARRADLAEVIGSALVAKATGTGSRTIAKDLGRSVDTVRGWLRRFAERAEAVRAVFTVLLVDCDPDPVVPAATGSLFADAVAAVVGAAVAVAARWPVLGAVSPWLAASAASGGRLLAPSWP
jgi:Homeodomain-like domain